MTSNTAGATPSSCKGKTSLTKAKTGVLQDLRDLHAELLTGGRLGDLPNQSKLASKAIAYCLKVFSRAESDCECFKPDPEVPRSKVPARYLCPACQRALRIMRIWLQVESLSVKRAAVEENLFRDMVRANTGEPAEGAGNLNFAALVRWARENSDGLPKTVESKEVAVG